MARQDANIEYVNVAAEDFSEEVQVLLLEERAAYDALKAIRAKVLAAVKAEVPTIGVGREIKATTHTRWGQWQLVIGDSQIAKPKTSGRQSLAEFLAGQRENGRAM